MAARFWVGGNGTWDTSTTTHWSASSGGAGGASAPTASDNVTFDTLSNATAYTVTVTAAACGNLTIGAPLVGDLTLGDGGTGTGTIDIRGSFSSYATLIANIGGSFSFSATTTGKTVTTNGVTFACGLHFTGVGGGWTFQDNLTLNGGNLTLVAGTLDLNGKTFSVSGVEIDGATTRTLTMGAASVTCTQGDWNAVTVTGLTFNVGTSTITMSGANQSFSGGGLTYKTVNLSPASATLTVGGTNTFTTLTITGSSALDCVISFNRDQVITGTLTITGNSAANRILLNSTVPGTSHSLTAATVTVTKADFADINGLGAGSWNLAAVTSGNCGGNSNITFTTAADQYWFKNTGNMNDATKWFLASGGTGGAGRVPLPQDTVRFDSASFDTGSQTVTMTLNRTGGIVWTGATNTPAFAMSTVCALFGSLTLISGMSISGGQTLTFQGRSTFTLTSAGKTFSKDISTSSPGGTLTLQDALSLNSTNTLSIGAGTFTANNFNLTIGSFATTSSTGTRVLNMGTGTWTVTGNAGNVWSSGNLSSIVQSTSITNLTYSGSAGTRSVGSGRSRIGLFKVSAGTDTVSFAGTQFFSGVDFTGFSGTWSGVSSIDNFGDLIMSTGMTRNFSGPITLDSTAGGSVVTSNGKTFANDFTFDAVGGSWTPTDTFVTTGSLTVSRGTLSFNDQAVTLGSLISNGTLVRSLLATSSVVSLTGTGTVLDFAASANFTFTAGTSIIKITDTSSTGKTLNSGGKTFNDLYLVLGAGSPIIDFTGSGTFHDFFDQGTAAHTIRFPSGSSNTVTYFRVYGSSGNLVSFDTTTGSGSFTLSCAAGPIICDFLSIRGGVASGGAVFFAGGQSTNAGGNTGWKFYGPARSAQGAGALLQQGIVNF